MRASADVVRHNCVAHPSRGSGCGGVALAAGHHHRVFGSPDSAAADYRILCAHRPALSAACAALLPRALRRAAAHRAAAEQFLIRGIARKKDRSGILIFVSLAERYARIVADEGIVARVPQSEWQGAVDLLVAHMRAGRIADGFIAAIEACGVVLMTHFPRTKMSRDELPDRIYLI